MKNIKHITTILLLLIIPLSAPGLAFSVHSCKSKNIYSISLFSKSNQTSDINCCCSKSIDFTDIHDTQTISFSEKECKTSKICCNKKQHVSQNIEKIINSANSITTTETINWNLNRIMKIR